MSTREFSEFVNIFYKKYPTQIMSELYKKFYKTVKRIDKQKIIHLMVDEFGRCRNKEEKLPIYKLQEDEKYKNANLVYKYYNYEFRDNNILSKEGFELEHLLKRNCSNDKRYKTLITAFTQSGKTFVTMAISNMMIILGMTPIHIVKDRKQKMQLMNRFIKGNKKLQKWLKKQNVSQEYLNLYNEPIYLDSKIGDKNTFLNNVSLSLKGKQRKTIICLWEVSHIQRVYNLIKKPSRIALFIDEAHTIGGYKNISKTDNGEDIHNTKVQYDEVLLDLKVLCEKIFLITATPQDILMLDPDLYTYGIVFVPNGKDYRGIEDWNFKLIEEKDDIVKINMIGEDCKPSILDVPESFINMMSELSNKTPIPRVNKYGKEDYHPINVLAKFENTNERQHTLIDIFREETKAINEKHQDIINAGWCVMTYNQFGVRLYHDSLEGMSITIGSDISIDKQRNCLFTFPNVEIGEVWSWLFKNGGCKRFPRLITIAYKSAEEGITFSTNPTHKNDSNIHINYVYFKSGKTTSSSKIEQSMGRCNGNHGDYIPITLWSTLKNKEKLILGYNTHKEQIKSIFKLVRDKEDVKVINHIRELSFYKNRVPNKYYSIPDAHKLLKTKLNPNSYIEIESMRRNPEVITTLEIINPEEYDPCQVKIKLITKILNNELNISTNENNNCKCPTNEEIELYGHSSYNNICKLFKKWSLNKQTKISQFMFELSTKIYHIDEYKILCKNVGIDYKHLQIENYTNSKGYGRIIEHKNNIYRLYPVLHFQFTENFTK
jgi:hypothetical protein